MLEDYLSTDYLRPSFIGRPIHRDNSNITALSNQITALQAKVKEDLSHLKDDTGELIGLVRHAYITITDVIKLMIPKEFNLVSIAEAQRSTAMSVSMNRLSWITVCPMPESLSFPININQFIFLPLMFASVRYCPLDRLS